MKNPIARFVRDERGCYFTIMVLSGLWMLGSPSLAQQDLVAKPNLSETNVREPPKANPNAGAPSDYLLIPISYVDAHKEYYLRFDVPVSEVRVDNRDVLIASVSRTDLRTVVLQPQDYGG